MCSVIFPLSERKPLHTYKLLEKLIPITLLSSVLQLPTREVLPFPFGLPLPLTFLSPAASTCVDACGGGS